MLPSFLLSLSLYSPPLMFYLSLHHLPLQTTSPLFSSPKKCCFSHKSFHIILKIDLQTRQSPRQHPTKKIWKFSFYFLIFNIFVKLFLFKVIQEDKPWPLLLIFKSIHPQKYPLLNVMRESIGKVQVIICSEHPKRWIKKFYNIDCR
jgi:hypothetical protein